MLSENDIREHAVKENHVEEINQLKQDKAKLSKENKQLKQEKINLVQEKNKQLENEQNFKNEKNQLFQEKKLLQDDNNKLNKILQENEERMKRLMEENRKLQDQITGNSLNIQNDTYMFKKKQSGTGFLVTIIIVDCLFVCFSKNESLNSLTPLLKECNKVVVFF